ncbi:hypothetical protein RHSIM_Rhsim09G0014100 [Rhododendron simsii]|uniref:Integrase catalytic domain-containing protein n=1 Tax=Rhododendron simsii TaxID=118357 RepID=A0A834LEI8_RHOSS|nr:hypothetical protein RHSIM_Rhsim09G0014100 [Rhododendron simsii]
MSDKNKSESENSRHEATLEVSNPYSLHHSDHPGMILVSKLLEGDNYSTWSRAMRIALSAKNKIGFVTGSIKPPSSTDTTFPLWQRCNDMVLSWLLNSIHPDIATSVIYAETSAEVWADLQERFSQGNDSRIYQIKQEIGEHRQGQQSISVYYTKLKALWDELSSYHQMVICTCGGLENLNKRDEKEKVMQFLMGLNENYGPVRGQILLMQPLPDTRRVYSLVLQQEKQIEVSLNHDSMNHHAMLADHKSQAPTYSFADQNNKTIQVHQVQKQKNTLHCSYCDQDYHSVERCYYLHGFPVGHKLHGKNVKPPNQRRSNANHAKSVKVTEAEAKPPSSNDGPRLTTEEYNQVMALLRKNNDGNSPHFANATGIITPSSEVTPLASHSSLCWIIDSGATDHVTSSIKLIDPKCMPKSANIQLPDGGQMPIESIGSFHVTPHIKLDEVLKVPQFQVNLLSVSKLTRALKCIVIFFPDFCVVQDAATRKMIGLGKQHNGLYYLAHDQNPVLTYNIRKHSNLWHQRLGHPSSGPLQVLTKLDSEIYFDSKHVCEICPLAKQTRLAFPSSSISSQAPFDLIHSDIWGPHRIKSHSGARYFLTIVDDFTRYTWIHLMSFKSETQGIMQSFISWVKTQFNCHIKTLRSDNGSEFLSMKHFLDTKGIVFHHSCTSTPQQNGVVERKHRHLLNVGRALRFQANLPLTFWGESVQTACYLINCLPTPLLPYQSPYQKLHKMQPTYTHLRTFGCLCYATNLKPKHKFDQRAHRCIFIGYPLGQKGYRVYELSTHKFFSTRDVVFYEQIFPFHIHPRELHQDEVVLPLPHDLDIQPLPTPIGPNSVEPIHYDTANSHNNTTEPTTEPRTEPTTDPTEPTTLDHPIVQPPSPIPYLCRGERVKQPNTMLRDFHLYNMAMVAPSQSSSPSENFQTPTKFEPREPGPGLLLRATPIAGLYRPPP